MINFFNKNSKIKSDYYPIIVESINGTVNQDIFDEIYNGNKDGLLIKDFITKEELYTLKDSIENWEQNQGNELINNLRIGKTIGKSMFDIEVNNYYFDLAQKYNIETSHLLKIPISNKIFSFLQNHNPLKKITSIYNSTGKEYLHHTIRILKPNMGGLHLHSDLLTHKLSNSTLDILEQIDTSTILSIFINIQEPDEGGQLVLYNKKLKETNINKLFIGDLHQNIRNQISQNKKMTINIPEGALILFNAGQQWHEITPIRGKKDRITLGCFVGKHKTNNEILFWA